MGVAKFEWNDQDLIGQTLTCQAQVQKRVGNWQQAMDEDWSYDGTVREVITYGLPLHDVEFTIAVETDGDQLAALRRDGLAGIDVTFTPDTDTPATTATIQIVAMSPVALEFDGRLFLYTAAGIMRRLDGELIP